MNLQLRENLLLRNAEQQDKPESHDSEFSADMDVASELGSEERRGNVGANGMQVEADDDEEVHISANGELQELI